LRDINNGEVKDRRFFLGKSKVKAQGEREWPKFISLTFA